MPAFFWQKAIFQIEKLQEAQALSGKRRSSQ